MTAVIRAVIRCDWCGATTREYCNEPTARDAAHAQGWRRRSKGKRKGMGDICPMCQQQPDAKPMQGKG